MKKIIICVLILLAVASLVFFITMNNNRGAENNLSPAVNNVINLIYSISNAQDYLNAEKAYNELSADEKAQVTNYDILTSKKELYKEDLFLLELIEVGRQKLTEEEKERKKNLKNPSSYTVNDMNNIISYDKETDKWFLCTFVDYSAQNSLGGYQRLTGAKYYIWYKDTWTEIANYPVSIPEKEAILFNLYDIKDGTSYPAYEIKATFTFDDYTIK